MALDKPPNQLSGPPPPLEVATRNSAPSRGTQITCPCKFQTFSCPPPALAKLDQKLVERVSRG